jgi:hypothetical protein
MHSGVGALIDVNEREKKASKVKELKMQNC